MIPLEAAEPCIVCRGDIDRAMTAEPPLDDPGGGGKSLSISQKGGGGRMLPRERGNTHVG